MPIRASGPGVLGHRPIIVRSKKKMQREGVFREMKLRGHYEKPSERRVREKAEAIRRALSPKATGAAF
jgi:ribosomal protein S21